jgi:hypothetical protein
MREQDVAADVHPGIVRALVLKRGSIGQGFIPVALRFNIARKIELAFAHLHREAVPSTK